MSTWCPILKRKVLYLDCLDCEDKTACASIRASDLDTNEMADHQEYRTQNYTYRIIIAGSRNMTDYELIRSAMTQLVIEKNIPIKEIEIVNGTCYKGADALALQFAKKNKLPVKRFPAQWEKYGKKAGPIRNAEMARYASERNGILLAFWDGKSRGTNAMIQKAKENGLYIQVRNAFTGQEMLLPDIAKTEASNVLL